MNPSLLVLASSLLILLPSMVRALREARQGREMRQLTDRMVLETCQTEIMLGRGERALQLVEELRRRAGGASELSIGEHLVPVACVRGSALLVLERFDEALVEFEQAIRGMRQRPEGAAFLVEALVGSSTSLARLNRREEAILGCDRLLQGFGAVADVWCSAPPVGGAHPHIVEGVALMMSLKSTLLAQLGRRDESTVVLEQQHRRFSTLDEPVIQNILEQARAASNERGAAS